MYRDSRIPTLRKEVNQQTMATWIQSCSTTHLVYTSTTLGFSPTRGSRRPPSGSAIKSSVYLQDPNTDHHSPACVGCAGTAPTPGTFPSAFAAACSPIFSKMISASVRPPSASFPATSFSSSAVSFKLSSKSVDVVGCWPVVERDVRSWCSWEGSMLELRPRAARVS